MNRGSLRGGHALGRAIAAAAFLVTVVAACSSSSQTTGHPCTTASQCYPGLDASTLQGGSAVCLDQAPDGYCTHECNVDADCCAVSGECPSGFKEVCAPFESTGKRMCFLSCEDADIAAAPNAGTTDPTAYCQKFANRAFTCRSTGGGSENRKVCFP